MYHGSQVRACIQLLGTVLIFVTLTITVLSKCSSSYKLVVFFCCHSEAVVIALRQGALFLL